MGLFLVYILKSAICLAAFYLFYKVLLSRETFHRFNRFALLGLLALSALLPLLKVTLDQPAEMGQAVIMAESWILEVVSDESATTPFGFAQILLLCYLLGILFFFCRFVYSMVRLLHLLRKGRRVPLATYLPGHTDITLIAKPEAIAPFSWMRYIVVSEKDLEDNVREILLHECAHIRQHHSWDLLLAEVCILFQWFNPAAWLLKQELQTIHEYEADSQVLHDGVDARHYQLLLIKKAVGTRLYSMANNLNHSNLKKRITMMMKRKSNPWARCKYLYVLPLAVIAVTAFARPEVQEASSAISEVKVNDLVGNLVTNQEEKLISLEESMTLPQDSIYDVVDEMPQYPGGDAALLIFISENVKYPEEAIKAKVSGRVTTRFTINQDGSVSDAEIVRSVNDLLDAEALRVVNAMPNWTPGKVGGKAVKVRFVLPIVFNMQGGESEPVAQRTKAPEYPGGDNALMTFLARNMKYPAEAQQSGIQGKVKVDITIAANGNIAKTNVISSDHPLFEREALRVVDMLEKHWSPALNERGEAVNSTIRLPFSFFLADANGNISNRDNSGEADNEIVIVAYALN